MQNHHNKLLANLSILKKLGCQPLLQLFEFVLCNKNNLVDFQSINREDEFKPILLNEKFLVTAILRNSGISNLDLKCCLESYIIHIFKK